MVSNECKSDWTSVQCGNIWHVFSYVLFIIAAYSEIEDWIVATHWDTDVTHGALRFMNQVNTHRDLLLYIFITISGIHAFTGLLLVIGACLPPSPRQRLVFLPWLTLDMFFIVLTTALFVSWAFLSFFVHILVAIFFPVVSGALLGLWIYSWRNVREHFIVCGQHSDIMADLAKTSRVSQQYRKLPPASQSPPAELRTPASVVAANQNFHHFQVPV